MGTVAHNHFWERQNETMETGQEQPVGRKRWMTALSSRGQTADEIIATSGISFHLWRLYQHFWLVCLLFPLAQLVRYPTPPVQMLTGVGALAFFAASYTWLMWRHPIERDARGRRSVPLQFVLWTVLTALALVLSLTYGLSFLWLFIGVSAMAGVLLPLRRAFVIVSLLMFFPPVISVVLSGGISRVDWPATIALMLLVRALGLDMLGLVRLSSAVRELHTTRKALARLKVEEERQRLSRDLHDVLGQTLSVITLKSELARLLIGEDQQRCAHELSEIERVARTSLRNVREAVAGYRHPRLESELEGVRHVLEAAGIEVQIDALSEALAPAVESALAWTVRESVTNVIRHSRAQHCLIRLTQQNGTIRGEILNDGGQRERVESMTRRGLGLAGLQERVSALGGQMEAGPCTLAGKASFRVCVELPMKSAGETQNVREEYR